MESVVISISRNYNFCIADILNAVLNSQCHHQLIELIVLVDFSLLFSVHILRLSTQRKNCLIVGVARMCHGTGSGLSLGDENHGILALDSVLNMIAAILEFWNLDAEFSCGFPRLYFDRAEFSPEFFVGLDFLLDFFCRLWISVEPVVQSRLHFAYNPCADVRVAELIFGLAFKNRILYFHEQCSGNSLANILGTIACSVEFIQTSDKTFLERIQVGSSVRRVLTVDK